MSKALQHLKRELSSNLSGSHKAKGRSNRSLPRSLQQSGDNDAFRVLRSLEGVSHSTKNANGKPIKRIQTRNKAQKNYKSSGSIRTSREAKADDKQYFRRPSNALNTERDREVTQSMFAQQQSYRSQITAEQQHESTESPTRKTGSALRSDQKFVSDAAQAGFSHLTVEGDYNSRDSHLYKRTGSSSFNYLKSMKHLSIPSASEDTAQVTQEQIRINLKNSPEKSARAEQRMSAGHESRNESRRNSLVRSNSECLLRNKEYYDMADDEDEIALYFKLAEDSVL